MLDRLSALIALCLALSITPIAAQDTDPFLRPPAVHPDGDEIAFSYQGDLWTVPIDGGTPERLTIHEAYEGQPRWGPEGNRVAFTSDRFGNSDLYAMDAAGSTPDRLTYHSTGDVITAVDSRPVANAPNFYQLLEGTVEEKILLDVTDPEGEERTVRIRPTGDLSDELYREWVEEHRALVEEYSDGRLGYVHVEGMNWESFEHFERELYASAHDKDGLLIDVRYNGGGWTTDYLMTVFNVQRHAYTVPRGATDDLEQNHEQFRGHYPFGERLPYAAWTEPVAALVNKNSYSNAEIFSHAFKNLGHGPLVGQPTFGAVISTGGMGLMDGSYVRMPFRAWYVYQTDENMEHGPARPDLRVSNPPGIKAEGEDPQLRRAVEALLNETESE
ncbi:MAG: hypothetical protein BRD31_05035 [Bacteroidetes bacterium QH_2_64_26]|nr:MAG: hypothetical protein BRD31_05035 [Bacteroidetes bacterium QH_2_64_26]